MALIPALLAQLGFVWYCLKSTCSLLRICGFLLRSDRSTYNQLCHKGYRRLQLLMPVLLLLLLLLLQLFFLLLLLLLLLWLLLLFSLFLLLLLLLLQLFFVAAAVIVVAAVIVASTAIIAVAGVVVVAWCCSKRCCRDVSSWFGAIKMLSAVFSLLSILLIDQESLPLNHTHNVRLLHFFAFDRCTVKKKLVQMGAAVAQWIRQRLPSCGPMFKSHAHYLCVTFI